MTLESNETLEQIQEKMVKRFNFFTTQKEKYQYLMEMGKKLPAFDETWKSDTTRIQGCLSKVWLHYEIKDGRLHFYAASDAHFVSGMISLLLQIYQNRTPDEILNAKLDYLEKLGLLDQIAANRANGLNQMIKKVLSYAEEAKAVLN